MARSRNFLYGLGIGLIIAAVGVQMMSIDGQVVSTGAPPSTERSQISLQEEAEKQGLSLFSADELRAMIVAEAERLVQVEQPVQPMNPMDPTNQISLYISGGLTTSEIAHALFLSGVIASEELFLNEVNKNNLNRKIRAGYYEFDGPQDPEHLVAQMTGSRQ